ncbi:MAG TPA: LLM class flavin-dependent oxidoreductase [Methylocella sp.]|nr:LLM class flavin-dependent oxidoreductase [Methylocella sp.]
MRTGLFCTYENPQGDYASAYAEQTELVQLIETLGFDEAWVAEHHFNPNAASPSCLCVLNYLAARTSRLRLGSAAVLLPFRNPIQVAEDVATLDILSQGRFDFGIAKGGPFPLQNKHFEVSKEESRSRAIEALSLIQRLFSEDDVHFKGEFFNVEGVSLTPKPLQKPVPTFIGTSTADAVAWAAQHHLGVMGAPPFPVERLKENLQLYRQAADGADPRLVLIRFYHVAATREQAEVEAGECLRPFIERMRATTPTHQPDWTAWLELTRIVEDSLIGTAADIRDKILKFETDLAPYSLILKPLSPSFARRRADLECFAREIWPLCDGSQAGVPSIQSSRRNKI